MKSIVEKIKETSNIPFELLTEKPAFPKKIKIEITSRCDLDCFFCSRTYKPIKKGDIDKSLLFRLLDEAKELGVKEVGLFWLGESLLVKELPSYIDYAKGMGMEYVFLTTNGRLATPEKTRQLFDSGLDSIKYSINAGTRDQYRKVCGVDAFDQVISNLKYAYQYRGGKTKPAIYASTVFEPDCRNDYDAVNSLIRPYVDEHYPLRLYGEYTFLETNDFQKEAFARGKNRSIQSMLPCWSLFTEPHISFDGFMSACYCDHDENFYMADLNKVSLLEGWHSEKFARLRWHHLKKEICGCVCENCIAYAP